MTILICSVGHSSLSEVMLDQIKLLEEAGHTIHFTEDPIEDNFQSSYAELINMIPDSYPYEVKDAFTPMLTGRDNSQPWKRKKKGWNK